MENAVLAQDGFDDSDMRQEIDRSTGQKRPIAARTRDWRLETGVADFRGGEKWTAGDRPTAILSYPILSYPIRSHLRSHQRAQLRAALALQCGGS